MDATNIASAHILDIVFDGRNKAYGAYQLQRYYSKRMTLAMSIVLSFCALFFFLGMRTPKGPAVNLGSARIQDSLSFVDLGKPQPKPATTAERPRQTRQVAQTQLTAPLIVSTHVLQEASLPPVSEIDAVATTTQDGIEAPLNTQASSAAGNEQVAVASPTLYEDTLYTHVEKLPEFPGDWRGYLQRNLQYPDEAQAGDIEGKVQVQFIVDKEGNISEVRALNDPGGGLGEEAMRIIRRSPAWRPAEQNGRKVKYMHVQTIIFRLQ